jgi:hypothetical protein
MASQIVDWRLPNMVTDLRYSDVRLTSKGGKTAFVSFLDSKPVFQTPSFSIPFGVSEFPGDPAKKSVVLRATSENDDFMKVIVNIDERNVEWAFKNQESLFGEKEKSIDVIRDRYVSILKHKNKSYPPGIEPKIYDDSTFYNSAHENLSVAQAIQKGGTAIALIEFSSIWVINGRFGMTLKLLQMKVLSSPKLNISELAIMDEE